VAASDTLAPLEGTFLRDEVVIVLLARLLDDVHRRLVAGARPVRLVPELPLTSELYAQRPAILARERNPDWAMAAIRLCADNAAALTARLEQIDLGPLRLSGLFPVGNAPIDLADLHQLVSTVGVAGIADFSLQLLPSLLETKRHSASQQFAIDGYSSIERRGQLDALLPSELAHDDEVFAHRALSEELLYYGHERIQEGSKRVHGILIDASASMRGARAVFARGLGLALAKKLALVLAGGQVWLRFFDSRLHQKVDASALGGTQLPYFLCFRSERGRNYARVFEQLGSELRRPGARANRDVAITFITHAECHIPRPLVESLAQDAALYGIFILPTKPLALDYLPLLRGHQVVTADSLVSTAEKRRRALEIVTDVVATIPAGRVETRRAPPGELPRGSSGTR
jgi:hypothetical protein